MCGITGFWQANEKNSNDLQILAKTMAGQMEARGPDDCAEWVDEACGVGFGFRRLAIMDLSPLGRQPMVSRSGRYVIIFNGEVYNFLELRLQLEQRGQSFRGGSDTEVILAAVEEWGVQAAVEKFVGMFAIALWDSHAQNLYLIRDRLGIKPLYYGWMGDAFLFGSELKALRAHPAFRARLDYNSVALFVRHSYVPAPYSIFEGVHKLPPGSILKLSAYNDKSATPVAFWSVKEVAEYGSAHPFEGSEAEAIEQLESLLSDAVKLRMIADVPLGAFLSGGIDSSTVVALMQTQSQRPVKTFTIGFNEDGYDEAAAAKKVAAHLGTEHTELYLSSEQAQAVIPELPQLYDEPFSDSSQIPTYLVSKLARQHVTVSLSGDGGDELFAGYTRYLWATNIWNKVKVLPRPVRGASATLLNTVSADFLDQLTNTIRPVVPASLKRYTNGHKMRRLADILAAKDFNQVYSGLVSHWQPDQLVRGGKEYPTALTDRTRWAKVNGQIEHMSYLDMVTYLPDDILTKLDRATMGASLEGRVPLLDHRVVEFAWRIPLSMKLRNGQGKWLLRQVLYKHVPKELIERPKQGFGVPIAQWLKGPLHEWSENLLSEKRLQQQGYFNAALVRQKWAQHLKGSHDWSYYLWDVLMFQAWLDKWGNF